MSQIANFLAGIRVGDVQAYKNMIVYALHVPNGHARGYQTLDEALSGQAIQVQEVSEGGSVPTLAVNNTGSLPVLLVLGEELVGAKQNRVLNTSLLVPATSQTQIPVSCVERGRWSYQTRDFSTRTTSSHLRLRRDQTDTVTRNLRSRADYDADQRQVWAEIERKIDSHHTPTPTRALYDVYGSMEEQISEYLKAFAAPESQGMLVAINGGMVGGDIFDHAETLHGLWPKLIRSYVLDALEQGSQQASGQGHEQPDPSTFLAAATKAASETYELVGIGTDVRLSSDEITGSALVWQERVIHASLFSRRESW